MIVPVIINLLFYNETQGVKMSKFTYLQKAEVKSDLIKEYPILDLEIDGETPILFVKTASDANVGLFKRRLLDAQDKPARKKAKKVTKADIEKIRSDDAALYAEFVVTGWKNVIDDSKKTVEFTQQNCEDYLSSLPTWIFDELRDYCSNPINHSESLEVEPIVKK